jgi:polyhydroxyalkanoate synthase
MHLYLDTELTFVLTSGGHNAGIVSEPGHKNRSYQIATSQHDDHYIDPETWAAQTQKKDGSWWREWVSWLDERSGASVPPPAMGNSLAAAPGTYVFQR